MGKNYLRQLNLANGKWTDKTCAKHKHNFVIPCVVRLIGNENKHIGVSDYTAMKCDQCLSFIDARFTKDLIEGFPVLEFENTHFGMTRGMKDITFIRIIE